MTSRERLVTIARGGEVDQKPNIWWPGGSAYEGDALVVAPWPETVREAAAYEDRAVLAEIGNPFYIAKARGLDLPKLLDSDPAAGGQALDEVVNDVRLLIEDSLSAGADGIFYRLHGATPEHTSPMEYGGHFLERDRELLEAVQDARFNMVFVVGGEGAYLDFVSDLPAHAFGWDDEHTGVSAAELRQMRRGALATYGEDGDIQLASKIGDVLNYLETTLGSL
jgi:hypothetical protein